MSDYQQLNPDDLDRHITGNYGEDQFATGPREVKHPLTDPEKVMLVRANWLLTTLTTEHSPACECELCTARMLTDVQDAASFTVIYLKED